VFAFSPDVIAEKARKRKIKAPEVYEVNETEQGIMISFFWRKVIGDLEKIAIFMFVVFGLVLSLVGGLLLFESDGVTQLLGAGIGLVSLVFYYLLACFAVNKTTLSLDEQGLQYRHGPLPYSNKQIAYEEIAEIELDPIKDWDNYRYLNVIKTDGQKIQIDSFQLDYAEFMKQQIDEHLGLTDEEASEEPQSLFGPDPELVEKALKRLDETKAK
jgi:hypothetical protein